MAVSDSYREFVLEQLGRVTPISEYLADRRWRSLYCHDRRMYRFLRSGAERLQQLAQSHGKSPATASEIRKALGISKSQVAKVRRAFIAAGLKV